MAQYKLTKEDYNNLEKLLDIENKIIGIYRTLEVLDASNQKDSEKYKQSLTSLTILLNLEEMLYSKLGGDPRRLSELLFYISGYNQVDANKFLNAFNCSQDDLIKTRIHLRLEYLLSVTEFSEYEDEQMVDISYPESDEIDWEVLEEFPNPAQVEKQYFYGEKLNYEIERDVLNTILVILSEYLLNPAYKNIQSLLVKFKYQLSFLFKRIELSFLNNNFEINPTLYWGANIVIDEHNSDQSDLELSKESYAEDLLYEQAENFRELVNADINDLLVYGKAIICQIIIRSGLLFVKDKTIRDYINYIMTEIHSFQDNSGKLDEIIRNSINKFDLDKLLPNILRLKLD